LSLEICSRLHFGPKLFDYGSQTISTAMQKTVEKMRASLTLERTSEKSIELAVN